MVLVVVLNMPLEIEAVVPPDGRLLLSQTADQLPEHVRDDVLSAVGEGRHNPVR